MMTEQALEALARLVARLEEARPYVTREDIAAAWKARPGWPALGDLLNQGVEGGMLLRDTRTRFDATQGTFHETQLYRVNRRRRPAIY